MAEAVLRRQIGSSQFHHAITLQRYDKPGAETSLSLELCQDKTQLFENAVTEESKKQDEIISTSDFCQEVLPRTSFLRFITH
jgi:hypothetical protein